MLPNFKELPYRDPWAVMQCFGRDAWSIFIDSASGARYSYIARDPFQVLQLSDSDIDPWSWLQYHLQAYQLETIQDIPPFQGGAMGVLSYALGSQQLGVAKARPQGLKLPLLSFGLYDALLSFDHETRRCFAVSTGLPAKGMVERRARAQSRLEALIHRYEQALRQKIPAAKAIAVGKLRSNFTAAEYMQAVETCRQKIYAGDCFEVNISQHLQAPLVSSNHPLDIYAALRAKNPSPYAAYMHMQDWVLASNSPECFIKKQGLLLETCPIKGTIARAANPQCDRQRKATLRHAVKDHAEHLMIVDLLRNDLAKIALPHSIEVKEYAKLCTFSTVHHLVSKIQACQKPGLSVADILKALFPGGSITGAPKKRAMEIIAEIESSCRGAYCGAHGMIGFDGDMHLAITIRSAIIQNQSLHYQAGGAVILQSDPWLEYQETLDKAQTFFDAFAMQLG
jgi:para-aminobenzoate synthetase component I